MFHIIYYYSILPINCCIFRFLLFPIPNVKMEISIIDLDSIIGTQYLEKPNEWKILAMQIRHALGRVGFMQLINHGIPEKIMDAVFENSKCFFNSSDTVKMKYEKSDSLNIDSYHGYTKPGDEIFGKVAEIRETFDWIEGRGVYPDDIVPNFNSCIHLLNENCKSLTKLLLQLLAIGLGLDDTDFFVKKNQHWVDPITFTGITNIRVAHYPRIPKHIDIPEGAMRIGEHTDFATLTLLFQDHVGGLEAKHVNGDWIPVQPIHNGIVINTGDLLEYWTSGIFQATPHRVIIPVSEVREDVPDRYSVTFFNGPDVAETVTPLNICKTTEETERLVQLGKVYSSDSVNAYEHVFRKVRTAYSRGHQIHE